MMRLSVSLTASAALLAGSAATLAATFAEVTAFDIDNETASGTIGKSAFSLTCTLAVVRPGVGDDGGVLGAVINGSSDAFDNAAVFTPSIASADDIRLGGASSFQITFSPPVTNPTLHIHQLANNVLHFTSAGTPITFTLLSSDGNLTVIDPSTIQGLQAGLDASGSLLFEGQFDEITWSASLGNPPLPDDGFFFTISIDNCGPADITTDGTSNGQPDGVVTLSDFSYYLALWAGSDPAADITLAGACDFGAGGDGVDLSDFSCYLAEWALGCP